MTTPVRPKTAIQAMRENLQWLRANGASVDEQKAEMERWKPKIQAANADDARPRGFWENAGGVAEEFASGATLGLSGLVDDAASTALNPNQSFAARRAARRTNTEAFREENPGTALAAGFAGGIATPSLGIGKAIGTAGKGIGAALRRGAGMAAEGALGAGIEGTVRGTDDFTGDAMKRALATGVKDAFVGAVAAPVVGGALGAGARGAQRLLDRGKASAGVRAVARGVDGLQQGPAGLYSDKAGELMGSPDVMAADVLPGGARKLRAAMNVSPAGEELAATRLRERGANVGVRAERSLADASGLTPNDVASSVEELTTTRAQRADPLYAAARAEGEANRMTPRTPELDAFLNEPDIQGIVGRLQQTRQFRDLRPDDPKMLDAIYKALSDKQADLKNVMARAASAGDPENIGRFLSEDVAAAKTQAMDAIAGPRGPMPSMRAAVSDFADQSALKDAYTTGVEVFNRPAGEIRAAMKDMTTDQVDLMKRGVVDAMRQQIGRTAPNPDLGTAARQTKAAGQVGVDKLDARARLREVFGDKGYLDLVKAARQEGAFSETAAGALQNSTTAKQLADMGVFGSLADDAAGSLSLSPSATAGNMFVRGLRRATNTGARLLNESGNREAADLLTRPGRGNVEAIMAQVKAELGRREAARQTGQQVATRTARGARTIAGDR